MSEHIPALYKELAHQNITINGPTLGRNPASVNIVLEIQPFSILLANCAPLYPFFLLFFQSFRYHYMGYLMICQLFHINVILFVVHSDNGNQRRLAILNSEEKIKRLKELVQNKKEASIGKYYLILEEIGDYK